MAKKQVWNQHHVIYGDDKNKECIRLVRKGLHLPITLIRRFTYLTDQEIDTVKLELELKRRYSDEESV